VTVRLVERSNSYIGLSGDVKPTGVLIGSTFWASDTNVTYVTYDGTNWSVGTPLASPRLLYTADTAHVTKTITFTGAAGLGQVGAVPLFTLTGAVWVTRIIGYSTLTPVSAGGGTLALGVTGSTALFIAATTATGIVTGDSWQTATPNASGLAVPAALKDVAIVTSIIGTVGDGRHHWRVAPDHRRVQADHRQRCAGGRLMTTDWGGYRALLDTERALDEAAALEPLVDCPVCGDILAINAAGSRSCPMAHFRTNETTKRNWR
jgi:hypothetical protein